MRPVRTKAAVSRSASEHVTFRRVHRRGHRETKAGSYFYPRSSAHMRIVPSLPLSLQLKPSAPQNRLCAFRRAASLPQSVGPRLTDSEIIPTGRPAVAPQDRPFVSFPPP